jgi:hypothetical protein
VLSVSSALSLSLSKVFLPPYLKNIPKNINVLKRFQKVKKETTIRYPRLRARCCSFLKSFPAREGQKHFRAYQKGARKRRERESGSFCVRCSDPRFSFLPVLVFRPRAKIHKRLQSTFFCFPTQNIKSAKFAFFWRVKRKKKRSRESFLNSTTRTTKTRCD